MATRQLADWMKAYGEYTADNEAPQVFHMWVGLGVIAGAAQRKIFMRTAYYDVHTNMYIILTSPPGVGKKTTAMRIGKNILKAVEPKLNFATESASPEALMGAMSKISNPAHQSLTLFSSELGTLMGTNPVGMVDFLTDIYDGNPDWNRQTIAHNLQTITRPWLNIIGGTTPQWMGDHLSATAVEGGFVARCIYPFSDELILRSPFPEESPEMKAIRLSLTHDLAQIAQLEGEFKFTEAGKKFYVDWYLDKSRFPSVMDSRVAGYYARKHIHILKVAMSLSLSVRNDLLLDEVDLAMALRLLDATEPGMRRAFSAVGKNETATDLERVYAQLLTARKLQFGELLALNYANLGARGLTDVLNELRYMGRINVEQGCWYIVKP